MPMFKTSAVATQMSERLRLFRKFRQQVNVAEENLQNIRQLCGGTGTLSADFIKAFRAAVQTGKSSTDNFVAHVANHLEGVESAIRAIEESIVEHQQDFEIEVYQEAQRRRAERIDMWKLWVERTVRWVVGVALFVFAYSTAVNLSENPDVGGRVHVPVHDWFDKPKPD